MFKIQIQVEGTRENLVEYKANIVPIVGDKVHIDLKSYTVIERTIFPENESYIFIYVKER